MENIKNLISKIKGATLEEFDKILENLKYFKKIFIN